MSNDKRLHVHSLPLFIFGLAVIAVTVAWVLAMRQTPALHALLTPSLDIAQRGDGSASVTLRQREPVEQPGIVTEITPPPTHESIVEAGATGQSLAWQMAVDQAVTKDNR